MSFPLSEAVDYEAVYQEAFSAFERATVARAKDRTVARRNNRRPNHRKDVAYCVARHAMMMALLDVEDDNVSAQLRKAQYMNRARLPPMLRFDEVLHYIDRQGRVHLFYGGGISPLGFGRSPDGHGHGHTILVKDGESGYKVEYQRSPEGQ